MKVIWIILASGLSGACADSEAPASGELQQTEIIDVHGCRPGWIEGGEGVCIDPWHSGGGGADEVRAVAEVATAAVATAVRLAPPIRTSSSTTRPSAAVCIVACA